MEIKKYQLRPDVREFQGFNEEDNIYLTVQIGNGQIAGSKVIVDNQQKAKGDLSQPTFIGNSQSLESKEITIETNVLDVNHFTNMCVITTSFFNQENKILFSKIDMGEAPENGIAHFKGKYKISILTLLILFSSIFITNKAFAQSTNGQLTFQSLETPSSPGFILLDKTPSSIEKPTTPQGFGVTLLGLLNGNGGAMEFAPFWLVNHPKLTAEKMYKNKFPILYNFSVSAATIKTDSTSYLAGGFRTRLIQSYGESNLKKLDSTRKALVLALANVDPDNPKLDEIEKLQKIYSDLISKPIFTIDFAGAIGGGSNTNSYNDIKLNRWSTWLSLNWRPKGDDFYITAVSRYINNEKFEDYADNTKLLDVGSRLNYDINKFCISVEYLQRFNLTKNNNSDNRIALVGSYSFTENIFLTTTLGKNFSDVNNVIALAGLNFGISKSKIKAF